MVLVRSRVQLPSTSRRSSSKSWQARVRIYASADFRTHRSFARRSNRPETPHGHPRVKLHLVDSIRDGVHTRTCAGVLPKSLIGSILPFVSAGFLISKQTALRVKGTAQKCAFLFPRHLPAYAGSFSYMLRPLVFPCHQPPSLGCVLPLAFLGDGFASVNHQRSTPSLP